MTLTYQKPDSERYKREMYCKNCHIYSFRSDLNAKCSNCDSTLITVIRSVLTGERITGRIQHGGYQVPESS